VFKRIKEYGEDYVRDSIGERALNLIKESGRINGAISIPAKVEQHFSAGERQIFAMALYQSLAEIRTAELPFVIDTPLARIDREHRKNILANFFARLPGQVIILSTDEEINGESISLIREKMSDIYLIKHQSSGTSTANRDSYFKGVLD
jgi:DNA sulfur modification protein DndD